MTPPWKLYEQFGAHRPLPNCGECRGTGVGRTAPCLCCFIPWGPNHPEPIAPAVKVRNFRGFAP